MEVFNSENEHDGSPKKDQMNDAMNLSMTEELEAFSTASFFNTKIRGSMNDDTVSALVFLKHFKNN